MQSQTKAEMFIVVEKYHQILLRKNMKAAPDKSHFLKSRIDEIQKLQSPSNQKKKQELLGTLNFLRK